MLSWKISQYLDSMHEHLFYNVIQTQYVVDGYMCECGHEDIILKSSSQELEYHCPKCNNHHFHNANIAHKSFDYFLEMNQVIFYEKNPYHYDKTNKSTIMYLEESQFPLDYCYSIVHDNDKIVSRYATTMAIPKTIDYARKKIISHPIELYSFLLNKDGSVNEYYCMPYDYQIFTTLRNKLNEYIKMHKNIFNVPHFKGNPHLSYQNIAFFAKYPWLKEFNFYYWEDVEQLPQNEISIQEALNYLLKNRNEKSIKKELYQNYQIQMQRYHTFKTTLINSILDTIKDTNFIVELLQCDLHCAGIGIEEEGDLKQLLLFLKKHYSEKQIKSFIKQIDNTQYLTDLLREFIYIGKEIDKFFSKTNCNLRALHNELIRCSIHKRKNQIFHENITYLYGQENAETTVLGYSIKLPYTGEELVHWAEALHNCLSGYFDAINNNYTTIYGFFLDGKIEFSVQITDNMIIQANGVFNEKLTDAQNEVLKTWFHRYIYLQVNLKSGHYIDI